MAKELAKAYDPKVVEEEIYRRWEESGFFDPDHLPKRHRDPFTIVMPPPNANGALHLGHAVFVTLQDILIRFWRMRGKKTLWLPGADHAGFETQVVFDKKLEKEGRNRFEIPRGKLFKEIWDFTQANKVVMEGQLRKLGASCDWSREKFTLDPAIIKTVYGTFKKLYDDGLAYRGVRVINWCPKHQTALSDLEVKYVEREDPLYYIKYGPLVLATVRPETKFGDTALAVNPSDTRYRGYVGKELEIDSIDGDVSAEEAPKAKKIKIKIIADQAVDPAFGTGVVKVTPAHDPADFEIWQRHQEEIPGPNQVIDERGRMKIKRYAGMKVADAREKVVVDMEVLGLLEKVDTAYKHQVATCYKCENVLEPLPKQQWFIRMTETPKSGGKSLRDQAVDAVKSGAIRLIPEHTEKVFFHWMENLRDWNISRQITWGIRIPAWYCVGCQTVQISPKIRGRWFIARHGRTDWNDLGKYQGVQGVQINEEGKKQALLLAEQLRNANLDLIISSDLPRAAETAAIVGKTLGVEVVSDIRLREKAGGIAEGTVRQERSPELQETLHAYDRAPEGGESWQDVESRIEQFLTEQHKKHAHKNVLFMTHGAALQMLEKLVRNLPFEVARAKVAGNCEYREFIYAEKPCEKCSGNLVEQDPDVFDTWFSSGQWPFATLGYPDGKDFKAFYPTDVMETGYDILFFWVARMIMLGLYRTGEVPFKTVYLHGLVRDKDRKKMSKSKGNVIDPLAVAEQYGTDAVRMALVIGNTPGQDMPISEDKIRGYRNFANKIWNIHRFLAIRSNGVASVATPLDYTKSDQARLSELKELVRAVTKHIESFEFHPAAETLYHYIWHTFADEIIEEAKPRFAGNDASDRATALSLLTVIHETIIKLLHPFMPYLTETLWQSLQESRNGKHETRKEDLLMVAKWPDPSGPIPNS